MVSRSEYRNLRPKALNKMNRTPNLNALELEREPDPQTLNDKLTLALAHAITELIYCHDWMGNNRRGTRARFIAEAESALAEARRT